VNGAPGRLQAGQLVAGRFTVAALVGSGEISEVYDVRDPSSGRAFALKLFASRVLQSPQAWLEAQQVARHAASLGAPAIVPSFDFGVEPAVGAPFALSELVSAPSLERQVATQGALAPHTLAELMRALAPAFDAAHAAGLVHRVLGPRKIFLSPAGMPGAGARVGDFGVSRIWAAAPPPPGWAGSPGWVAPEAASAQAPSAPSMDVFALGLLAFFALTGRPIFLSLQARPMDPNRLWAELTSPLPPASRRAAELGVQLAPSLDAWFERALALAAAGRFQSVGEMSNALVVLAGAMPATPQAAQAAVAAGPPRFGRGGTLFMDGEQAASAPRAPVAAMPAAPMQTTAPAFPAAPDVRAVAAAPPMTAPAVVPVVPAAPAGFAPAAIAPADFPADSIELPGVPKKGGLLVPLLVVGGVLLLSVVGIAAWLVVGRLRGAPVPAASATAAVPAAQSASPAPATPSAAASQAIAASPVASGGTSPASGSAAPPGDKAAPDAGAEATDALVKLTCDPGCDEMKCDGKSVEGFADGVRLAAGKHVCTGSKQGYVPRADSFVVKAGEDVERKLVLVKLTEKKGSAPPKKCGTFINPCK
jgi:hypothetical protein